MEFYDVINTRRSVRSFSGPAPEKTVRKIILTGTKAANASNAQPWEFIVVTDPDSIKQLSDLKYQCNMMIHGRGVAAKQKSLYANTNVVAVCNKKRTAFDWSCWMAVQNMALAATAEGYGIIPSTLWSEPKKAAEKLLGLPDDYELTVIVLIGKQKAKPPKIERRPDFSWLHFNKFGNKT